MPAYDEKLGRLRRDAARKGRLEAMLRELRQQQNELEVKAEALRKVKLDEQADVDRLESGGLTSMLYSLLGKTEEKLTKERREAAAAALKYEAAERELSSVRDDIERCESELLSLGDCEREYEAALEAKREELRKSSGAAAQKLLQLETEAAGLESRKKEILEAIAAGSDAMTTADDILAELDSAEDWATWDVLGGGLIADIAKHDHLDGAQMMVERLQSELRAFKTELADVGGLSADTRVNIDGFLRFADYFFDSIIVDLAVLDRIGESLEQVQSTRAQICSVLDKLHQLLGKTEEELSDIKKMTEETVLQAQ